MAARTSPETIEKINELYAVLGVKSKVAKELGISPATVTKYLIPNYVPKAAADTPAFNKPIDLDITMFKGDLSKLCELSEEEWKDLKELQKEILI